MELLQLEYFYAVAQNQHMTRTAEQLHIAQPSLTQSIRRLEKEMKEASKMLEFEYAALLRDQMIVLKKHLQEIEE